MHNIQVIHPMLCICHIAAKFYAKKQMRLYARNAARDAILSPSAE